MNFIGLGYIFLIIASDHLNHETLKWSQLILFITTLWFIDEITVKHILLMIFTFILVFRTVNNKDLQEIKS